MHKVLTLFLLLLLVFSNSFIVSAESNEQLCLKFYSPFVGQERHKYQTILNRCISEYGAYRSSNIKGHKHAGTDLRGKLSEKVYPIGAGKVSAILWSFPNQAVAITHPLADGEYLYSLYIHIEDIQVKPGDRVDENTVIARLFNSEEFRRSGFATPHLHLEIRKSMDDQGRASYASMSMADLNKYCINPKEFFKEHLE